MHALWDEVRDIFPGDRLHRGNNTCRPTTILPCSCTRHRRRLVINIGGKNLGHKYWGAKLLGKYVFRPHSTKNFEKNPLLFSKTSEDLFLVIDNYFQKFTTLHSKFTPFFFVFVFLCLCFCFLSCFFK